MSTSAVLALNDLISDFEVKQRGLLLMSIDKAIDKAMKKQSEMLDVIKAHVESRHRVAIDEYRDEITRTQPSLVESAIRKTLSVETNAGLVDWISDEVKKRQALECISKLRSHLASRQGNAFRSDFEGLLVVYMDALNISMMRGSPLNNRIEDLHEALISKADHSDDLVNLVYRVRWGCQGVRSIGNARSHQALPLSESEILELCGCFSAIGAAMPTLALKFDVCNLKKSPLLPISSDGDKSMNCNSNVDLTMLQQLHQAANSNGNALQSPFDYIIQLMANNGITTNPNMQSATYFHDKQSTNCTSSLDLSPGFSNGAFASLSSCQGIAPSPDRLSAQTSSLSTGRSGLTDLDLTNLNGLNGSSTLSPPLSRLGSIGSTASNSSRDTPPLPSGYNDTYGSVWSQHPLSLSSGSPKKAQLSSLRPGAESPLHRSSHLIRSDSPPSSQPPLPPSGESPHTRSLQPSTAFALKQSDLPTQAMLALIPKFTLYHNRPTELPKENDRIRKAMFARMLNHIELLPKATLCPLPLGHDPTCPLSHTYMEVMTYNPLYKRLICRQPSHYWGNQLQEDDSCVCLHIDTGLSWEWMDDAKRLYCPRGPNCTNSKCYNSHSFEEMCWYNPSYKIKRCTVRTHDHIARARGTIKPPLDCSYYHIEEGKNCDKRGFTAEDDHVGVDVQMLFTERTHKLLADRLEAVRYARANNL